MSHPYMPAPGSARGYRCCPISARDVEGLSPDEMGTYLFNGDDCHLTVSVPQSARPVLYWPIDEDAARALRAWTDTHLEVPT